MGGWGTGSFENDEAQEFLSQLKSLGIDDLTQILSRAADQDNYLEASESSIAIAAAEVIAALKGTPSTFVPGEIADWIIANKTGANPGLNESARRAVNKIRTNSELKDLWLEAEGLNEWSAGLRDLEQRLAN